MTGFVGPLVEAGYRVVALDAPAHGQSPGRQLGPYHYADAVLRAGDSLGPLEGSIAHSFGGFALINAIHNGLRVKRAALIAPATTSIASHPQLLSELLKLHPITRQRFFALADQLARSQSVPPDRLGRGLNLPALFLHDPGDQRVAFVDSLLVSERWRGARLEAVPGLGHNRILSDQNVIGAVVMFMAGEAWSDQRGPRLGPFTEARMVTPSDQRVAEAIFHRLQEVV